ncbi:MAG: hypothetical protein ACFKPT_13350 [Gloeotrichia echinulata GP01]
MENTYKNSNKYDSQAKVYAEQPLQTVPEEYRNHAQKTQRRIFGGNWIFAVTHVLVE